MCPALIFAASRKDRVIGRTIILDDSMRTRNGFSQLGAPSGRRCAIVALIDLTALDIIKSIHIGRPILKVNRRCLVILNVYGNRPIIFNITTIKKIWCIK
jgi:hypothetical protein